MLWTVSYLKPLCSNGNICWESPPRTTTFPLKGFIEPKISLIVMSKASKQYLCIIGAPSHIISFAFTNNSALGDCFFMLHVEFSLISSGIENLEWAIQPLEVIVILYHLTQHWSQFLSLNGFRQIEFSRDRFYQFPRDHKRNRYLHYCLTPHS